MDRFADVYNAAWKDNWGFSPYSKEDLDYYSQELQLVFDSDWFMVAETAQGETVAMAITVPDINQVLRKMNGRLLPTGWWHFLNRGRIIDRVRVGFLGVKPEYQHTGVAAALYIEHFDMAIERPQKWGEMGWILETNDAMNRGMEGMGGRVVKKYRVVPRIRVRCEQPRISSANNASNESRIRTLPNARPRVVIPCPEVIQPRLFIQFLAREEVRRSLRIAVLFHPGLAEREVLQVLVQLPLAVGDVVGAS